MTKEAIAKAPQRRAKRTTTWYPQRLKCELVKTPYAYRIVNDTSDRVLQLQNEDWEICDASELQIGDRRIGNPKSTSSQAQVSVGGGIKGYVMKKRIDWHEEDQAAKQEYVNKTEAATKQEALDGNYGKLDLNAPR
jgi:hypothetical protein